MFRTLSIHLTMNSWKLACCNSKKIEVIYFIYMTPLSYPKITNRNISYIKFSFTNNVEIYVKHIQWNDFFDGFEWNEYENCYIVIGNKHMKQMVELWSWCNYLLWFIMFWSFLSKLVKLKFFYLLSNPFNKNDTFQRKITGALTNHVNNRYGTDHATVIHKQIDWFQLFLNHWFQKRL